MGTGRRWIAALAVSLALMGCSKAGRGELTSPAGAPQWDPRFDVVFDDHYTAIPVQLTGRAPGDVIDQKRFAQRLGHADLVVLVTVDQVWSRGLYAGTPQQRASVSLGKVLRGELARGVRGEQVLELRGGDALPAELGGQVMLLFLRWAPGEGAGFHHHLMRADEDVLTLIDAMVRHARAAGQIDRPKKGRRSRT
jgi:hypothetical protein